MIRLGLLASVAIIAGLAFIQPFRPTPRRVVVAPEPALPAPSPEPAHASGLIPVDSTSLIAHIRKTTAKGVVVNAWASWCASCKGDIPVLVSLDKTFGSSIEVLFASVDEASGEPAAIDMLRGFGAKLPSYVVTEPLDTFKPAMSPHWPGMLPATFLFDPAGKLRFFWGGPILESDVVPLLRRYLAGEHIDGEANFALAPGAVTK
jgi:thiol-disulfide isomerase/thioredoxin